MQWRSRVALAAPLLLASLAAGAPSEDRTRALSLSVYVPLGCPGQVELRTQLAARVSGTLAASRVVVRITATDNSARLALRIEIIDSKGVLSERNVSGSSCEALLGAAATILSIALVTEPDPDAAVASASIDPSKTPPDTPRRARETPFTAPPTATRESEPEIAARIGAVTAIDGGTLPSVAPGVGVVVALESKPIRVELAGVYFPQRRSVADANLMAGGDLAAYTATARACFWPGPVAVCGGGEWSLLSATGFGTDRTSTGTFFLWGMTAGARWEMQLGERVIIAASGELIGRPRRPEFRIANPDRIVHRPGWLSVRLWLHAEVALF